MIGSMANARNLSLINFSQLPPIPAGLTKAEWDYHIVESSPGDAPCSYMNLWYKELWDDYYDVNNQTTIGIVIRSHIKKRYARAHPATEAVINLALPPPVVTHTYNTMQEGTRHGEKENGMDVTVTKHEMAKSAFGRATLIPSAYASARWVQLDINGMMKQIEN